MSLDGVPEVLVTDCIAVCLGTRDVVSLGSTCARYLTLLSCNVGVTSRTLDTKRWRIVLELRLYLVGKPVERRLGNDDFDGVLRLQRITSLKLLTISGALTEGALDLRMLTNLSSLVLCRCAQISELLLPQMSLRQLFLVNCQGIVDTAVPQLPINLLVLEVHGCVIEDFHMLPPRLEKLKLINAAPRADDAVWDVSRLPRSLKEFSVYAAFGFFRNVSGLPQGLEVLYLNACSSISDVSRLPSTLQKLSLKGCTDIIDIRFLPSGINELNLSGLRNLEDIDILPKSLKLLILCGCVRVSVAAVEAARNNFPGLKIIRA